MKVQLNGAVVELPDAMTVAELVAAHAESPKGIAVAVGEQVVPRSSWSDHRLVEGDRVELLVAARGG